MVFIFSLVFHLNTCFSNFERLKKRTVQGDLKLDSCEQGIQREVNPRKKTTSETLEKFSCSTPLHSGLSNDYSTQDTQINFENTFHSVMLVALQSQETVHSSSAHICTMLYRWIER